ncbi:MAG TPA: hypothetical protein VGD27_14550 [Longimicrobiales bacterium]
MRVRFHGLLLCALLVCATDAHAQQTNNNERCRAALLARGMRAGDISPNQPCFSLATAIMDMRTAKAWIDPRDLQPSAAGNAAPAGTAAQASAVPTVQPTPVAAATIAAVAQDSGQETITAISINPATLFSTSGDKETLARLARLADVSVFFPVSGLDQDEDGKLDYAGVRARINFTASSQASGLLERVNERLLAILHNELALVNSLNGVLLAAPDPGACAQHLMGEESADGGAAAVCGVEPELMVDESTYAAFRRASAAAREAADAKYLGLDLRFDYGDPSFGKVRNAYGTALQAGLGFGRRFNPSVSAASSGLRGRLGVRYVELRDTSLTDFQIDGGIAYELGRVMQSQRLELSAGVEFRYSGKDEDTEILRTRFAEFRAALKVPLANSSSIALSLSAPLMGEISPTLAVGGNWQQLLAGLMSGH